MQEHDEKPVKQRQVMLTPAFINRMNAGKAPQFRLANQVLVGTHHKTGTAWMLAIFVQTALMFGLEMFYGEQDQLASSAQIFFQDHSRFNLPGLTTPYRVLHLIRDPRDVIVSACFYHQKASEAWLHVPDPEFGGLTYQEKLNSYESLADQLLFEMEHSTRWTIDQMLRWNYQNPACIEVKYEVLIMDTELSLFRKIFTFLGFPPHIVPRMLSIAYRHSLFSGKAKNQAHIRSGRAHQWPAYFTPDHKARFLALFGDALVTLGYEENDEWSKG